MTFLYNYKSDIERKLAEATSRNEFFDAAYLVTSLNAQHSSLGTLMFQVDFSPALLSNSVSNGSSSSSESSTIYKADLSIAGENFIDYLIRNGLNRIERQPFACYITHVNSVEDFYVQKSDPITQNILNTLHATIEAKCNSGKLNPLKVMIN